jgi:hypothetical protein
VVSVWARMAGVCVRVGRKREWEGERESADH